MKVRVFNPDNDLALASGLEHYTAPKAARLLREAGAALPLWYADDGDAVVCDAGLGGWLRLQCERFGMDVSAYTPQCCPDEADVWGWSLPIRSDLIGIGVDAKIMPSADVISSMRVLSHRRTAARLSAMLREMLPDIAMSPAAVEVTDMSEAEALICGGRDVYVKAPWSSSGRGVVSSATVGRERALKSASDFIRSQGSAMIEQAVDRVIDFARLFRCEDGRCEDIGTSVFVTDANNAYRGNLLAAEDERRRRIAPYFALDRLGVVAEAVRCCLESIIAPHYVGILGVDMLVGRDGVIHPAVEINLRKTMGYVANTFAERYLQPGRVGEFAVLPIRQSDELQPDDCVIAEHRLSRGILNLVPLGQRFAITARVSL